MDKKIALASFNALSQPTRLDVFRLLIKAGHEGMSAGAIGKKLNIRQNTMSTHLSILAQTPLIYNQRDGRTIRYFADYKGIRDLMTFLMQDCCGDNEEICAPILETLTCNK